MKDVLDQGFDSRADVIGILAAQARVAPDGISEDTTLEAMGLDSMGLVEVIFALEEHFEISVPFNANDGAGAELTTVGAVIRAVETLLGQAKG